MQLLSPLAHIKRAQPTQSYAEACARLAKLVAEEGEAIHARCRTSLLHHGGQTEHALVFIHGFTNCPYQFHQLAPLFHQQGWNTLSIRLPGHGFADRLTTALSGVRPNHLVDVTTEGLDIGRGLGKHLTILGFSLGGVLAAWAAQERTDLDHAVLVSPALGILALPRARRHLAAHLLTLWPNFFQWWHPALKEKRMEPLHAYPRFGSRSLAAMMRLGLLVQQQAARQRPKAKQISVITNPCDMVVDNATTAQVVADWRAHQTAVQTYAFPREWALIHDLIDPLQPEQQIARVYPQLLQWLTAGVVLPADHSIEQG